jgi:hypothetical protein
MTINWVEYKGPSMTLSSTRDRRKRPGSLAIWAVNSDIKGRTFIQEEKKLKAFVSLST